MQPIQITLRSITSSITVHDEIMKHAKKIGRHHHAINTCRVVIDKIQKHKHKGKVYSVNLDVNVPGKASVICRKYNENLHIAIRDSFIAIEKLLQKHIKKKPLHVDRRLINQKMLESCELNEA